MTVQSEKTIALVAAMLISITVACANEHLVPTPNLDGTAEEDRVKKKIDVQSTYIPMASVEQVTQPIVSRSSPTDYLRPTPITSHAPTNSPLPDDLATPEPTYISASTPEPGIPLVPESLLTSGWSRSQGRWYSGDTHLHNGGVACGKKMHTPRQLFKLMTTAGLHVGAVLVWGINFDIDIGYFSGKDSEVSTPERIVHYDLEVSAFPSSKMGHIIALGLEDIQFPRGRSSLPIAEWATGQGAVVGVAHAQNWPPKYKFPGSLYEIPINIALGNMHFLEINGPLDREGFGSFSQAFGFQMLWGTLLNSGFSVAITGASDYPCAVKQLDWQTVRTYVWVEGPLSYAKWIDGIRKGRTVVAAGSNNFVSMTVNDAMIGETVLLPDGGGLVDIVIDTYGNNGNLLTYDLELILNGEVVDTEAEISGVSQRFKKTISIDESSWIAARSPWAQTGATYILVAGRPVRASERDAQFYVEWIDELIEISELQGDALTEAKQRYRDAQKIFAQRAADARAR